MNILILAGLAYQIAILLRSLLDGSLLPKILLHIILCVIYSCLIRRKDWARFFLILYNTLLAAMGSVVLMAAGISESGRAVFNQGCPTTLDKLIIVFSTCYGLVFIYYFTRPEVKERFEQRGKYRIAVIALLISMGVIFSIDYRQNLTTSINRSTLAVPWNRSDFEKNPEKYFKFAIEKTQEQIGELKDISLTVQEFKEELKESQDASVVEKINQLEVVTFSLEYCIEAVARVHEELIKVDELKHITSDPIYKNITIVKNSLHEVAEALKDFGEIDLKPLEGIPDQSVLKDTMTATMEECYIVIQDVDGIINEVKVKIENTITEYR